MSEHMSATTLILLESEAKCEERSTLFFIFRLSYLKATRASVHMPGLDPLNEQRQSFKPASQLPPPVNLYAA